MIKAHFSILIVLFALFFTGCQSMTKTTLILLPDEGGKVGAVTVKTKDSYRVVDKSYNTVTTELFTSDLAETKVLSQAQVNEDYVDLMKAQPAKPVSVILYFEHGSDDLVEESKAKLPQIADKIKERMPTEVTIIGHTDTKGTDEINNKLSKKRAMVVEKILKQQIPSMNTAAVQGFGSKDLLVPTGPLVSEPKNRRVEILIL